MKREFEKYFKLPFELDLWGNYVWDDDGNMVLQFDEDVTPENKQQEIVDWINGVQGVKLELGELTYEDEGGYILSNGQELISMRGFGYLTGTGGLNLPEDVAIKIQDDLADFIINKLK